MSIKRMMILSSFVLFLGILVKFCYDVSGHDDEILWDPFPHHRAQSLWWEASTVSLSSTWIITSSTSRVFSSTEISKASIKAITCITNCIHINHLRAKFFRGNINIYLHFMSSLHIDTTHVFKILSQVRPGPTYSAYSISWLLISWRCKEPGHQQPWYWPS